MKKYLIPFLLALLPFGVLAQTTPQQPFMGTTAGTAYIWTPLGCQQIMPTVATSLTVPTGAYLASLSVETQSIRMRDDGIAPTSSVGLLLPTGGPWPYSGNLKSVQIIQTQASAVVNVCYYR